jgi:hypothetical protein
MLINNNFTVMSWLWTGFGLVIGIIGLFIPTSYYNLHSCTTNRLLLTVTLSGLAGFQASRGGRIPSFCFANCPRISAAATPTPCLIYTLYKSIQHTPTLAGDPTCYTNSRHLSVSTITRHFTFETNSRLKTDWLTLTVIGKVK